MLIFIIMRIAILLLLSLSSCVEALKLFANRYVAVSKSMTVLQAIPLELTGQLDATKSWDVKFIFNGEEKVLKVREDTSILESVEKVFDGIESSCRNGVCTTCAGKVVEGLDNIKLAVHGLGEPQIDAGFVCTCQCYPTGPGVVIRLGAYEEVYESQYGQFELSYGDMKYGDKKKEEVKQSGFRL